MTDKTEIQVGNEIASDHLDLLDSFAKAISKSEQSRTHSNEQLISAIKTGPHSLSEDHDIRLTKIRFNCGDGEAVVFVAAGETTREFVHKNTHAFHPISRVSADEYSELPDSSVG